MNRRALFLGAAVVVAAPASSQLVVFHDSKSEESEIVFTANYEPILTIHSDGRITASKKARPDDAARAVLKALELMFGERMCRK